jgi:hypothetical protein
MLNLLDRPIAKSLADVIQERREYSTFPFRSLAAAVGLNRSGNSLGRGKEAKTDRNVLPGTPCLHPCRYGGGGEGIAWAMRTSWWDTGSVALMMMMVRGRDRCDLGNFDVGS